jgi:hypothetical protein
MTKPTCIPPPFHKPPYETGQVWTSSSVTRPAAGWWLKDAIKDREFWPSTLFMWTRKASK